MWKTFLLSYLKSLNNCLNCVCVLCLYSQAMCIFHRLAPGQRIVNDLTNPINLMDHELYSHIWDQGQLTSDHQMLSSDADVYQLREILIPHSKVWIKSVFSFPQPTLLFVFCFSVHTCFSFLSFECSLSSFQLKIRIIYIVYTWTSSFLLLLQYFVHRTLKDEYKSTSLNNVNNNSSFLKFRQKLKLTVQQTLE